MDLGVQAYSGMFLNPGEDVPWGRLRLVRCNHCGLAQLADNFPPSVLYGEHYGYRSGLSSAMVKHLQELAYQAMQNVDLEVADVVLDIGCSDGTLLKQYPKHILKLGYDPIIQWINKPKIEGAQIFSRFFDVRHFQERVGEKAKIITAIAMFYDLDNPIKFLSDLKSVLADDGIIVLELQFLPLCVKNRAIDVICHEHSCYYDGERLLTVIRGAGLKLKQVAFSDINGGSVRVTLEKPDGQIQEILRQRLTAYDDQSWDMENWGNLKEFIDHTGDVIRKYCKENQVVGLGASTKGNILLQHWKLNEGFIQCIGEINENKFGKVTPGTNIPIVPEKELPPGATRLVLPWWLKDYMVKRYVNDTLLFPLPEPILVRNGFSQTLENLQ